MNGRRIFPIAANGVKRGEDAVSTLFVGRAEIVQIITTGAYSIDQNLAVL